MTLNQLETLIETAYLINMKTFNLRIGQKQMVFASSTPIDEFYFEEICNKDGNSFSISYTNPLHLLLNQKRLNKLGQMGLDEWLGQFDLKKSSPIEELRKQCSDEDLLKTIKSRHLQAPAEILAWSRYMSQNLDEFNDNVKSVIAEMQQQQVEQSEKPE